MATEKLYLAECVDDSEYESFIRRSILKILTTATHNLFSSAIYYHDVIEIFQTKKHNEIFVQSVMQAMIKDGTIKSMNDRLFLKDKI